jgi:hypothetical protein
MDDTPSPAYELLCRYVAEEDAQLDALVNYVDRQKIITDLCAGLDHYGNLLDFRDFLEDNFKEGA